MNYLVFSDGVYTIDFISRTIRTVFTPATGETVTFGRSCDDSLNREWERILISTDKSLHFLSEDGSPLLCVPRVHDRQKHEYIVFLGKLENPERYFAWYRSMVWGSFAEPEDFKSTPFHLHEYDSAGRELAHRSDPQIPYPAVSYAQALFGLVTPMTEAATLVAQRGICARRSRLKGSTHKSVLVDYLENSRYYIPDTSRFAETPSGLVPGYIALIVLSAAASAIGCCLLARRYAFSRGALSPGPSSAFFLAGSDCS